MPRRRKGRRIDGIVLVDKPAGETSNRCLQDVRRVFDARKAGHTGTLDPFATGLLPLCFGEATKFGTGLLDADKSYEVEARWGWSTETGDPEGEVSQRTDVPLPESAHIAAALATFVGETDQVPPMYSALKQQGRRLHELARAGVTVAREPRRVVIHETTLIARTETGFRLRVCCSKGTYIRVLVEDLAVACGGLAHCSGLRRTAVGPFSIADSITPDMLGALDPEQREARLLPVDAALRGLPLIELDEVQLKLAAHGNALRAQQAEAFEVGARVRLAGGDHGFLGLAEIGPDGMVSPRRMVSSAEDDG